MSSPSAATNSSRVSTRIKFDCGHRAETLASVSSASRALSSRFKILNVAFTNVQMFNYLNFTLNQATLNFNTSRARNLKKSNDEFEAEERLMSKGAWGTSHFMHAV